jgi:hypothetical protein
MVTLAGAAGILFLFLLAWLLAKGSEAPSSPAPENNVVTGNRSSSSQPVEDAKEAGAADHPPAPDVPPVPNAPPVAPRPAAPELQPAKDVQDIDYSILFERPSMWDDLKLSPAVRMLLCRKNKDGPKDFATVPLVNRQAIEAFMAARGQYVRRSLSAEEDAAFRKLYLAKGLTHVVVDTAEKLGAVGVPPGGVEGTGFVVYYPEYPGSVLYWFNRQEQLARLPCPWEEPGQWNREPAESPLRQMVTATEAVAVLQSKDPWLVAQAVDWLGRAKADPAQRPAVLAFLRPRVLPWKAPAVAAASPSQTACALLFCHWAGPEETAGLLEIADSSAANTAADSPFLPAWMALAHQDPVAAWTALHEQMKGPQRERFLRVLADWRENGDPAVAGQAATELALIAGSSESEAKALGERIKARRQKQAELREAEKTRSATEPLYNPDDMSPTPENIARWLEIGDERHKLYGLQLLRRMSVPPAMRQRLREDVLQLIDEDSSLTRQLMLEAMSNIGTAEDIPLLTRLAEGTGPKKGVSATAVGAMLMIDPAKGVAFLEAHPLDRGPAASLRIFFNNFVRNPKADAIGMALIGSSDASVRALGITLLSEKGTAQSIDALLKARALDTQGAGGIDAAIEAIQKRSQPRP